MPRTRRPSPQTAAVVLALAQEPAAWHYGYQLCQDLELKAGSVYPILMRLADRGLLETAWERDAPAGRPPRHLYRLTGPGRVLAGELLAARPARRARMGRGDDRLPARAPIAVVLTGSALAAVTGRSCRSGLWAGAWAVLLAAPLVIATWLVEAVAWHQQGRGLLLDGEGGLGWAPTWSTPSGGR